jgi:hypothetical protein
MHFQENIQHNAVFASIEMYYPSFAANKWWQMYVKLLEHFTSICYKKSVKQLWLLSKYLVGQEGIELNMWRSIEWLRIPHYHPVMVLLVVIYLNPPTLCMKMHISCHGYVVSIIFFIHNVNTYINVEIRKQE